MTKQEQDKRWAQLSEESKKYFINQVAEYQMLIKAPSTSLSKRDEWRGLIQGYENVFGAHNLKPKIRTWEDVRESLHTMQKYGNSDNEESIEFYKEDKKLYDKLIATYKIAKLIELGYGGMVTEEEWQNSNEKFIIKPYCQRGKFFLEKSTSCNCKWFIAFHTSEQRDEFMSFPENVELVKQYHML